jgi:hypothetical protein
MRCNFSLALLASLSIATGQTSPSPDPADQKKTISDAAAYLLNQEQSLPNFICTQTTQRFLDYTGTSGFRSVDLIVEQLTYFDHHEDLKVFTLNGEPSSLSHWELGGAISSGEFGAVMKGIFSPQAKTEFGWQTFFTLRGRKMDVYSYRVSASHSDYHIVVPHKNVDLVTAYHGLIFIDDRTHFVHRITLHADDIPQDFPAQELGLVLDYDYTRIGDSDYLLPLEFEIRSRQGRSLLRNDVTYGDYRKFTADSSISFESSAGVRQRP